METFAHLPTGVLWGVFGIIVALILFLDLFVFHRKDEEPSIKHTLTICASYMAVALLFGLFVIFEKGYDLGWQYYTGYLVEFSLSMDNIFVMSLIFTSMHIPTKYQHRVLFWGILGAIIMRAIMILLGAQLVHSFHSVLYVFAAFLIFTGVKMLFSKEEEGDKDINDNKIVRWLKNFLPVTSKLHNEHFIVKVGEKIAITPLFLALLTIEFMDVIFAIDSIPAIFSITQDVFVVYTSNIFAILGLRSLYFLLASAVSRFQYLKPALSFVLIFIGLKIFIPHIRHFFTSDVPVSELALPNWVSLAITFGLLAGGIIVSLVKTKQETKSL